MGKSEGNMITLNDSPDEMYGKIMSWTDGMIMGGFELCTDISKDELLEIGIGMQNNENPMQYKKQLAREIISIYYNQILAEEAQTNWEKTFSEGGLPDVIPEINSESGKLLSEILAEENKETIQVSIFKDAIHKIHYFPKNNLKEEFLEKKELTFVLPFYCAS
jgi:tyrosyl-tRNA synthetase